MGSPIVFQTAPPHPASNARITWPPVLVGGPEASQKGFGLVRPANFTVRSAIDHLRGERVGAVRIRHIPIDAPTRTMVRKDSSTSRPDEIDKTNLARRARTLRSE